MTTRVAIRAFRSIAGGEAEGVEVGPDMVPVAFRIWRAGDNPTDHGMHRFTERSARMVLAEQEIRGNLYSIDVDHMSLDKSAPPECHVAVGWHRLEVRDGELWAVDVQWTDQAKAGLATSPPAWRYFSPAYDVDKKTGEVVSYLNTALTNNPATWSVTALAARGSPMRFAQILAAVMSGNEKRREEVTRILAAKRYESLLADLMGDDEEKKAAAIAALAAAFPDDDDGDQKKDDDDKRSKKSTKADEDDEDDEDTRAKKAAKGGEDDEDDETEKRAKAAKKAGEDDEDDVEAKKAARTLELLGDQDRRLKTLEIEHDKTERAKILATRPDLTESQIKALADEPIGRLPKLLGLIPKPLADRAAAARVTATRGDTRGDHATVRAARLPPEDNKDLRERMGTFQEERRVHWEGVSLVFPQLSREQATRRLKEIDTREPTPPGNRETVR